MASLKSLPNFKIIGYPTYGIFADETEKTLPNNWTYTIPIGKFESGTGKFYGGIGILPDIKIPGKKNYLLDKYLNKNPFRSIYFAALSMAAELSSGILAMAAVHDTNQPISMLVLDMKAQFKKKAVGKIVFTCTEGKKVFDAVQKCLELDEGQVVMVNSIGTDGDGNEVAAFEFSWTFKRKN